LQRSDLEVSATRIIQKERRTDAPVFRPAAPVYRRYERDVPGDLMHVDTKKLGRLPRGGGKRFGPHNRDLGKRGWEYIHVAVDDRTRVPYVERLSSEGGPACAGFVRRALAFFADLGAPVRQVMTDNAFAYIHSKDFAAVLAAAGATHVRTPSYTPRWNGKAEAFIGILLREWAYARPYADNRARAIALPAFVHSYTHRRPHGELGGQTPMQRLLADVHKVNGKYSYALEWNEVMAGMLLLSLPLLLLSVIVGRYMVHGHMAGSIKQTARGVLIWVLVRSSQTSGDLSGESGAVLFGQSVAARPACGAQI
jgi:transposase InsO family protein